MKILTANCCNSLDLVSISCELCVWTEFYWCLSLCICHPLHCHITEDLRRWEIDCYGQEVSFCTGRDDKFECSWSVAVVYEINCPQKLTPSPFIVCITIHLYRSYDWARHISYSKQVLQSFMLMSQIHAIRYQRIDWLLTSRSMLVALAKSRGR